MGKYRTQCFRSLAVNVARDATPHCHPFSYLANEHTAVIQQRELFHVTHELGIELTCSGCVSFSLLADGSKIRYMFRGSFVVSEMHGH